MLYPYPVAPRSEFWVDPEGQQALQLYRPSHETFFPDHSHSEYNLVVCLRGSIAVTQFGESLVLEPGEALVGNVGQIHSSRYTPAHGTSEAVSLMVRPRRLAKISTEFGHFRGLCEGAALFTGKVQSARLLASAVDVAEELRAPSAGMTSALDALAGRMLIEILRAWSPAKVERQQPREEGLLPRWEFVRAFELMQAATKDVFDVASVARQVGSSSSRFSLDRARTLLEEPETPVKEIAYDLGFRSDSQFCTSFRQRFGLSPLQYRAMFIFSKQKC